MYLFGAFLFIFQTNIAQFVFEQGFGDATTSGVINTSMSAAGMITGIVFGRMQRVLKQMIMPVSLMVGSLGMLGIYVFGTAVLAVIGDWVLNKKQTELKIEN